MLSKRGMFIKWKWQFKEFANHQHLPNDRQEWHKYLGRLTVLWSLLVSFCRNQKRSSNSSRKSFEYTYYVSFENCVHHIVFAHIRVQRRCKYIQDFNWTSHYSPLPGNRRLIILSIMLLYHAAAGLPKHNLSFKASVLSAKSLKTLEE